MGGGDLRRGGNGIAANSEIKAVRTSIGFS